MIKKCFLLANMHNQLQRQEKLIYIHIKYLKLTIFKFKSYHLKKNINNINNQSDYNSISYKIKCQFFYFYLFLSSLYISKKNYLFFVCFYFHLILFSSNS